jgi:hypothetical protein
MMPFQGVDVLSTITRRVAAGRFISPLQGKHKKYDSRK